MSDEPKYLMRFVGYKTDGSGELKPTSPAGFKEHELQELIFDCSLEPWWEIVDDIPDLVLPEEDSEDNVFELVAKEGEISPPLKYVMPVEQTPEEIFVIDYESMTVPTLRHFIDQRGGTVERGWLKADLIEKARELEEAIRAPKQDEEKGQPEPEIEEGDLGPAELGTQVEKKPVEALEAEGVSYERGEAESDQQAQDDQAREAEHPDENEENSEPES